MKIPLTFKTPDVVDTALMNPGISEEKYEEIREELRKLIKYGEYLTIYYNTETKELEL